MYLINRIRSAKTFIALLDLGSISFIQLFSKLKLKILTSAKIGIRKWGKYSTYSEFLSEFARRYMSHVIEDVIDEGKIYRGNGYQIRIAARHEKTAKRLMPYYKGNIIKRNFKMYCILFIRSNVRSELLLKKEYMDRLDKTIDEKKVAIF
jgi:hypothetical protein